MVNPNRFYTYAYLREDRTPYYIGKGEGRRVYKKHQKGLGIPKDKSRIIFLKQNLTETEAFKHEIYMIDVFGRKDLATGILYNRTDGGEGGSGIVVGKETRKKQSEIRRGLRWWNNGDKDIRSRECPGKEWKNGRLKVQLGRKYNDETKKKMSISQKGENNYWHGKSHSEETKRKMSEKQKGEKSHSYGKSASEETRRKMSESFRGRKWWNDGCGNTTFVVECPGEGWVSGRGKLK